MVEIEERDVEANSSLDVWQWLGNSAAFGQADPKYGLGDIADYFVAEYSSSSSSNKQLLLVQSKRM